MPVLRADLRRLAREQVHRREALLGRRVLACLPAAVPGRAGAHGRARRWRSPTCGLPAPGPSCRWISCALTRTRRAAPWTTCSSSSCCGAGAQGYRWFNLGMAPLSGLEAHPLAPAWHRVGNFIFRHGEHFYNFEGLRRYKAKFDPAWEPRYLVARGGHRPAARAGGRVGADRRRHEGAVRPMSAKHAGARPVGGAARCWRSRRWRGRR